MNHSSRQLVIAAAALSAVSAAHAQLAITWYTIDGGGATTPSTGGTFAIVGTIGQPDAGSLAAGSFACLGGFWAAQAGAGSGCYANCDQSTLAPILNVNDFTCFVNRYAAGAPYANCDASTLSPVLNVNDFTCFLNKYATGCP